MNTFYDLFTAIGNTLCIDLSARYRRIATQQKEHRRHMENKLNAQCRQRSLHMVVIRNLPYQRRNH